MKTTSATDTRTPDARERITVLGPARGRARPTAPLLADWALPYVKGTPGRRWADRIRDDHTWEAFVERILNDDPVSIVEPTARLSLRDYQTPRVKEIVSAFHRGLPGYHLNYVTGSGKTAIVAEAVRRIFADAQTPKKALVIAPVSALGVWRSELSIHGTGNIEWITINAQSLPKLFTVDGISPTDLRSSPDRFQLVSEFGTPRVSDFDIVITDESHTIVNRDSASHEMWRRLIGWRDDGSQPATFTIGTSATSFTDPAELAPVAHLIAYSRSVPTPDRDTVADDLAGWVSDTLGITAPERFDATGFDAEMSAVSQAVADSIFDGHLGFSATAEDLGLAVQPRELEAIGLTAEELGDFDDSLSAVSIDDLDDLDESADENPLTRAQKKILAASHLKIDPVSECIADLVDRGHQVIIPCLFISVAESYADAMRHHGIPTSTLTGAMTPGERDGQVRRFQSGKTQVIATTVHQSISLHARQAGAGVNGQDATSAPRVTVFGDIITGGKRTYQAEGRGTRDGQVARAVYPYVPNSIEADWLHRVFMRLISTRSLSGGRFSAADITSFTHLADTIERKDR